MSVSAFGIDHGDVAKSFTAVGTAVARGTRKAGIALHQAGNKAGYSQAAGSVGAHAPGRMGVVGRKASLQGRNLVVASRGMKANAKKVGQVTVGTGVAGAGATSVVYNNRSR